MLHNAMTRTGNSIKRKKYNTLYSFFIINSFLDQPRCEAGLATFNTFVVNMKKNWNKKDHDTLIGNIGNKTIPEIAVMLGRTEKSVYLYCYRKKIPLRPTVEKNVVRQMFTIHFGSESFFTPNREFYEKVQISQKEFQKLWMGYKRPSLEILGKIAKAINYSQEETLKLVDYMQLDLFNQ